MSALRGRAVGAAAAGLAASALFPLSARFGWLPLPVAALGALAGILLCAALVAWAAWRLSGRPGARRRVEGRRRAATWLALALAAPAVINALALLGDAGRPGIHNISTDRSDPPAFEAALERRGPGSNPLAYTGADAAAQLAGYPDLDGLGSALSPTAAYRRARETALELGWEIYHESPDAGLFEATDQTFWFGFKDDVVVRVRAAEGGSRIDLRSVSRVGQGDLGANARRIAAFLERFPAEL